MQQAQQEMGGSVMRVGEMRGCVLSLLGLAEAEDRIFL